MEIPEQDMKDIVFEAYNENASLKVDMGYLKLLKDIFSAIPDIIGVYKPDFTVLFYNKSGYENLHKALEDVYGQKCYETFGRNGRCSDCSCERAIREKRIFKVERYIPELEKHFECIYNPLFDESGELILIIEQLRDITESKFLENTLKESEARYRNIVDLSPDSIVIVQEEKIIFANRQACRLVHADLADVIGKSIYDFIPGNRNYADKHLVKMLTKGKEKSALDYTLKTEDRIVELEILSSYLLYNGKPAVQSVIRDITNRKRELNSAAKMQRRILQKKFPLQDKAHMKTVYIPAKTVSGDFFILDSLGDDYVIGIIGDVSGKGVTAALNISAFNVLFREAIIEISDPMVIMNRLNRKIMSYLGESYIAACCFGFDFKNNQIKVVGAGINEFIVKDRDGNILRSLVKGPFLGMFEDSTFDEVIINFKSGDKIFFYTDGLESAFSDDEFDYLISSEKSIDQFICSMTENLENRLRDVDGITDDCTIIALEMG